MHHGASKENDTRKKVCRVLSSVFEARHVRGDAFLTSWGGGMRKHVPLRVVVYIFRRLVCGEFQRQRVCRDGVAGGIPRCSVSLTASHERRHVVRHGGTVMRYRMWRHFRDVACHGRPKRISGVSVRYWPIPF